MVDHRRWWERLTDITQTSEEELQLLSPPTRTSTPKIIFVKRFCIMKRKLAVIEEVIKKGNSLVPSP
jgi:hypothetical protein